MKIDISKIVDIELDGIDIHDWPDLCDAYISEAWLIIPESEYVNGNDDFDFNLKTNKYFRRLTDEELEWLRENEKDWYYNYIYENAMDTFY